MNKPFGFMPRIFWSPDDPAGDPPADPPATPPAGDLPADPPATPPAADLPADPPATSWWEGDKLTDDQRTTITAAGLTVDDPVEAVAKLADMERAAQKRLRANPDDLLTKPKDGQDVAEWLRANGEMLGIPDTADAYKIERPKDWPKEMDWDEAGEAKAREIAHKYGISNDGLQEIIGLEAEMRLSMLQDAEAEFADANDQMMTALQSEWGDQTDAKLARARQALSLISEKAGLDQDAQQNLLQTLGKKGGDANAWKLMDAIAGAIADDGMVGLDSGAKNMGSTPAEARAQLEIMRAPDGDYSKAVTLANNGDRRELERLTPVVERLTRLAAKK